MLPGPADHKRRQFHFSTSSTPFSPSPQKSLLTREKALKGKEENKLSSELLGKVWKRESYSQQMALAKATADQNQKWDLIVGAGTERISFLSEVLPL